MRAITTSLLVTVLSLGVLNTAEPSNRPHSIRVKAKVQSWSSKGPDRDFSERTYALIPGDSIAAPGQWRLPAIRLVRILARPTRGVFRVDPLAYQVTTPFNHQPHPGEYEVGGKGMVIETKSDDAGWRVQLTVLR